MKRYTVFEKQTYKDSPYDYVYIDYKEAVEKIKSKTETGWLTTIQHVEWLLNCDIDTALAVMGYMYQHDMLYQVTGTIYTYDYK